MAHKFQWWCDECGREMSRVKVQWPSLRENGWRYFDFCSYPCAEKKRATVLAEMAAKETAC